MEVISEEEEEVIEMKAAELLGRIQYYTRTRGDELSIKQKELNELKHEISRQSKANFTLELDIQRLENKIALLVKNRLSLEVVCKSANELSSNQLNTVIKIKENKLENYGKLFYILQSDTKYIARMCDIVKMAEIDDLLQIVMFNLYVNQYDEYEEFLLLNMFQKVLEFEFAGAKQFSTILRGNTALTRMITTYTKRVPGENYLKGMLSKALQPILDSNISLEIEPLRIKDELMTEEKAGGERREEEQSGEEIEAILQQRYRLIGELTDQFLDHLIASIEQVPLGIRWICKQIHLLVKKYFPSNCKLNSTSIIGGFFMLRFVGPAIVSPHFLPSSSLDRSVRRNLTLLAKVVQNITNNVLFSEGKAKLMFPLNFVIENNRKRVHDFLFQLTKVSELPKTDKILDLNASGNRYISITPNEIYFIHSLLVNNKSEIFGEGEGNEEIEILLQNLGEVPAQLGRSENSSLDLQLIRLPNLSNSHSYLFDQVYIECKYLLFSILNFVPKNLIEADDCLQKIIEISKRYAEQNDEFAQLEKIDKLLLNFQILSKNNIIYPQDDFANLKRDISNDISKHSKMIRKINGDIEKLKEIAANLMYRHDELQYRLDYFTIYLDNVQNQNQGKFRKKSFYEKKKDRKKVKFTHNALFREGVLIDSSIPEDRRPSIVFIFSNALEVGSFDISVRFGKRNIGKLTFKLAELLEKQEDNDVIFQNEYLKIDINNLIKLLNKEFIVD